MMVVGRGGKKGGGGSGRVDDGRGEDKLRLVKVVASRKHAVPTPPSGRRNLLLFFPLSGFHFHLSFFKSVLTPVREVSLSIGSPLSGYFTFKLQLLTASIVKTESDLFLVVFKLFSACI